MILLIENIKAFAEVYHFTSVWNDLWNSGIYHWIYVSWYVGYMLVQD